MKDDDRREDHRVNTAALTRDRVREVVSGHSLELRRLGVRRLALFGSVLRDNARAHSDVDLLVEFEPDRKTYDNFIRTAFLLEDLLGTDVDLVTAEGLSPFIGPRILRELEDVPLHG